MVAGRQKAQLGLIVNVAVRCGWCNVGSYQLQWPWQLEPVCSFLPWPKTGGKVKFNAHKRLYGSRKCWGYECFLGHKETWLKRNASNGRKLFFFFFHPLKLQISSFDCKCCGCIFLSSRQLDMDSNVDSVR